MNAKKMNAPHQGTAVCNRRSFLKREAPLLEDAKEACRFAVDCGRRLPIAAPWLLLLACTSLSFAGPRASASYKTATETTDSGGTRASSAAYTNDGSVGSNAAGLSTVAAPTETAKSGYIGQLYEVAAVQIAASPTTVNETTTRQLTATATLDDGSTTALLGTELTWSVLSGPLEGVNSSGLVTASNVYQDSAATVQGSCSGSNGIVGLTVVNVGSDDFGIYAGDGLPDDWQVQYFGVNNPKAAPQAVSDGSGLTNLFKHTAGLVPGNAASTFVQSNAAVPGQPGHQNIIFSPIVAGRTYTVQYSLDLSAGSWQTLTVVTQSDNGAVRTVTDNAASGTRKFYRVVISRP